MTDLFLLLCPLYNLAVRYYELYILYGDAGDNVPQQKNINICFRHIILFPYLADICYMSAIAKWKILIYLHHPNALTELNTLWFTTEHLTDSDYTACYFRSQPIIGKSFSFPAPVFYLSVLLLHIFPRPENFASFSLPKFSPDTHFVSQNATG